MLDGDYGPFLYILLVGAVCAPLPFIIYVLRHPGPAAFLLTMGGFVVSVVVLYAILAWLDEGNGTYVTLYLFLFPLQLALMIFWTALGALVGRLIRKYAGPGRDE